MGSRSILLPLQKGTPGRPFSASFRAAERLGKESDLTLGWGGLALGGLRIWDMPGNHYTLLREEVGALAARFQALLGGLEQGGG